MASKTNTAAADLDATKMDDGDYIYHDEGAGWIVVSASDLAKYADHYSYSEWCAVTSYDVMTPQQIEDLRDEAAEVDDLAQVELCDKAMRHDIDAVIACWMAIDDASAQAA